VGVSSKINSPIFKYSESREEIMQKVINQYEIRTVDSHDQENFFIIRAKDEGSAFNALLGIYPKVFKHLDITLLAEDIPEHDDMSVNEFNKSVNKNVLMDFESFFTQDLDDIR
jgi:hypothetical protein